MAQLFLHNGRWMNFKQLQEARAEEAALAKKEAEVAEAPKTEEKKKRRTRSNKE